MLSALTLIWWSTEGTAWRALGLVPPTDRRLYVGLALAFLFAAFVLRQNIKISIVGLVFGGIVWVSGWLIPAMIIHAMMDIAGGTAGFAVLGHGARLAAD